MTRLNGYRMSLIVVVFVVAGVFGGRHAIADFTFGEPANLGPKVNSPSGDSPGCFSSDGLEMYFDSNRSGGYGSWDIWVSTREAVDDDWGAPVNLGPKVNTSQGDGCAHISADGLELYFDSNRSGGYGSWDIWITTRQTKDDSWGQPTKLGPPINTSFFEGRVSISSDGLELYFSSNRPGGYGSDDIWVSRRMTNNDSWGEPSNLGSVVNSTGSDCLTFLSSDDLLLFFSEDTGQPIRPGGFGNVDMWVTRRTNISDPWGAPVNLGPIVNSPSLDGAPRISSDGSTLYFSSDRSGLGGNWGDICQAPILPVVDITGDYQVDIEDLIILIEHWGQNEPACDMGPMPWGDGIVDAADLEVLMSHYGQALHDPHFIAHWELDETEGDVAYDSTGENDATVIGDAIWQPEGGQINGALQLDGLGDYVQTPRILNPKESVFSVFVWIKGDVAGQAILSQEEGADWLLTDSQGCLMTALISSGRRPGDPLSSETIVTDGNWHRVGLVWDTEYRSLYVDDELVATDAAPQDAFPSSRGDMIIGTGSNLDPSTFWSGLIDDVRIYDRVVEP